ncbi:MAG TPA: MarR family transcriptional regulator [Gammaproteobacteria bacterium]|nr:MarR family transcriptional regulator [Gammaproteobacteria bacterium]MEC8009463.1 MarR family transcriptional regulator [Pseudomonadota bacterium]HBF06890.1 MarR family transcriptional regulator [Gammaproteobacteria bacterium]HCK94028.1 MarR family transcriptional regulator [Gammaproteobacteria bacterium]|tara:strand:- start:2786 stop:3256 length:471 start_codon:yes stop_codon:yes gene_type:complete
MTCKKGEQSLGFLMTDVARLMRRNFNRRAQELELTQAQWQTLFYISRNQGMRQSQLAEILEVQPISVGRMIDRMASAGWVERKPDPSDRRAMNLFLTDKAEPILEQMQLFAAGLRQDMLKGLAEEEKEQMMRSLQIIRQNLIGDEADYVTGQSSRS